MYAKWIDGLMDVLDSPKDGYKPVVFTEKPETPSGYEALFFWKETDVTWEQTWEIIPKAEDDLSPEEAIDILLGGAT